MKKKILTIFMATAVTVFSIFPAGNVFAANKTPMMRLYNENTGEHFYTKNIGERNDLVVRGWSYEGVGWTAPNSGDPVYRLYNRNSGDHHYTTSAGERDSLKEKGWSYEGIGWYSDKKKAVPLYREYNPNARTGTHNYTTSQIERNVLIKSGWNYEGIAWYGVADRGPSPYRDGTYYCAVRDVSDAYINGDLFVIDAPLNYSNGEYGDTEEAEYSFTYSFPFNTATLFYETDSGELIPGDATILSSRDAANRASNNLSGPEIAISVQNGYVEDVWFGA